MLCPLSMRILKRWLRWGMKWRMRILYPKPDRSWTVSLPDLRKSVSAHCCPGNMIKTTPFWSWMRVQAAQRAATGAVCFIACIRDGPSARDFLWKWSIIWMAMRPGSSQWRSRSTVRMPTVIWSQRKACTDWCAFLLSMHRGNDRHPLCRWM